MLNRWIIKQKLRDKYDFIFIDPPSNKGILMISTILASDYILIPQRLTLLDETGTVELFLEMSNDEFLSIEKEDVFLSPIRQLSVWTKAQEEQMPLREYILNKDRTYMSVLEEIKKIVDEILKLAI